MKKSNRAVKLYSVVEQHTRQVDFSSHPLAESLAPLQLSALSEETSIASSNASMILSQLHKEGQLIRIGKRPIYYVALQPLEMALKLRFPSNQFSSLAEFEDFLSSALIGTVRKSVQNTPSGDPFSQVIGSSGSLSQQVKQAKSALSYPPSGLHTLIHGPVGAGKADFAKCMYYFALQNKLISKNADFITYDCANYVRNPTQAISRLFGHIAGISSSAKTDHVGLFEYANNGILILNNADKLIPEVQEKLIRYMLSGTYGRLGEGDSARVGNVRIIACTSNYTEESALSEFFRLFPIKIAISALENRTIGERLRMVLYFFWSEARTLKRSIILDPEILSFLTHYSCPGNIAQLMNDIKFSCSLAYYDSLSKKDSQIKVSVHHLNAAVTQNLFIRFSTQRDLLVNQQLLQPNQPIGINGLIPFSEIVSSYLLPDPDIEPIME